MPDVQIPDDFLGVLYPYLEGAEQKYHLLPSILLP